MKKVTTTIAIFATAALTLLSCSKKKDTTPTNNTPVNDTSTQVDQTKLTSSDWQAVGMYNLYYAAHDNNITSADGISKYYHGQGVAWADSFTEKFTFHADMTYDHIRVDGVTNWNIYNSFMPPHGQWELADNNHTLRMTTVGGSSNHLVDYEVKAFTDHYLHITYYDSLRPSKEIFHMEFIR